MMDAITDRYNDMKNYGKHSSLGNDINQEVFNVR